MGHQEPVKGLRTLPWLASSECVSTLLILIIPVPLRTILFLFASLLEQCFVLLKDVDYAGHTRARDLHANVPPSRDTACHSRSQPRISYFHPGAYSLVGLAKCA